MGLLMYQIFYIGLLAACVTAVRAYKRVMEA